MVSLRSASSRSRSHAARTCPRVVTVDRAAVAALDRCSCDLVVVEGRGSPGRAALRPRCHDGAGARRRQERGDRGSRRDHGHGQRALKASHEPRHAPGVDRLIALPGSGAPLPEPANPAAQHVRALVVLWAGYTMASARPLRSPGRRLTHTRPKPSDWIAARPRSSGRGRIQGVASSLNFSYVEGAGSAACRVPPLRVYGAGDTTIP